MCNIYSSTRKVIDLRAILMSDTLNIKVGVRLKVEEVSLLK